jgi:hypothetical protein
MIPVGIADFRRGDTFDGIEVFAQTKDSQGVLTPLNLTGASILAQFKLSIDGESVFYFSTSDGSILVPNPLDGKLYFASRIMDYPAKMYFFDIQVVFSDGTIKTIVPTHSFKLIQDITN